MIHAMSLINPKTEINDLHSRSSVYHWRDSSSVLARFAEQNTKILKTKIWVSWVYTSPLMDDYFILPRLEIMFILNLKIFRLTTQAHARSKLVCHSEHTCHRFVQSDECYPNDYGYKRIFSSEYDVLHSCRHILQPWRDMLSPYSGYTLLPKRQHIPPKCR